MTTKATFKGPVKTVGKNGFSQWKTGSVCFDTDSCESWTAKLYLAANPGRVLKEVKVSV